MTLVLYLVTLVLAIALTLSTDHWLSVVWALGAWMLVGISIVRLFIIQHDCAHCSLFPGRRLNRVIGTLLGVLCLTPHAYWRRTHLAHHRTSGNLDSRGMGDIHTMTVAEYQALSVKHKLFYRLYRNPWVIILLGPIWQFVIHFRLPWIAPAGSRERASIYLTNTFLVTLLLAAFQFESGIKFVIGYLVAMQVAGSIGLVLFYVQHQFESAYWRPRSEWSRKEAALCGSSHLVLPRCLEWLVAGINLHHVHHLVPWVPNYRLRQFMLHHCLDQTSIRLLPCEIPSCFRLHLYSETSQQMVPLKATHDIPGPPAPGRGGTWLNR
ncbi:fatty acid desaturase [Halomonas sp. SpR1]|uniref:fatty acid desaturase n=1 Tax=Halomonas sp. SpR1 TaxID=3050462 RepID=UPI0027E52C97|nr:fatty acid desaturase [Halomonas sp. SpR1]MDQ7732584.1 fatty acid desaturase [Halomonas sp. SpR1]